MVADAPDSAEELAAYRRYTAGKVRKGLEPRGIEGWRATNDEWARRQSVGDDRRDDIYELLGCRAERGYGKEKFFRSGIGPRFHDFGVDLQMPFSVEVKAGGVNTGHAKRQLDKDERFLEDRGPRVSLLPRLRRVATTHRG